MKTQFYHLFLLCAFVTFISCKENSSSVTSDDAKSTTVNDIHSNAKPDKAVVKHLSLELTADFEIKKLSGTATYDIEVKEGADSIILDTKDLDIQQVTLDGKNTPFTLGKNDQWLGQALSIPVSHDSKKLIIAYSTRPTAEALQWLVPSQTAGKQHPYLFTQGEAILTRTWIPIQDSPGIRMTYDAKITVPKDLMAVMSASNPQEKNKDGVYTFKMDQPIPSYLIALAIGDLEFKAIDKRTGVYAEPGVLNGAANEFADMGKMVSTAESLYGPYQWGRYDVIVLPPSFPFGGMENPRLTFATPTIIAGDKSLTSLIAHELAHSWSGNLVTNATWNDFWLNEGFTDYFERRIIEALYDKSYSDMLATLGLQDLKDEMKDLSQEDTHLFLNLAGRNPDDGMTGVAYEKGALFLTMLEQKAGREKFDAFLKKYFADHKFQSMTTEKFLAYLDENLIKPNHLYVNVDAWVYKPGLPDTIPVFNTDRFMKVDTQVTFFVNGRKASKLETKNWSTHEWLHFIKALPDSLAEADMIDLDNTFGWTATNNTEIKDAWFKLAINQGYGPKILPEIRTFLVNVGRRKYLTPLYTALTEKGMYKEAKSIFDEAKPNYHSISANSIQALLDKKEPKI